MNATDRVPACGDVFGDGEHNRIQVNRVARDSSWADIRVTQRGTGASWTKRQKLVDGRFPYPVWDVAAAIATPGGGA